MGTIERFRTPGGIEGYEARDSWTDRVTGERRHKKRRFRATAFGSLRRAKAEAEAWLNQREADRSRGAIWEPSTEKLGSLLDRWANLLGAPLSGSSIVTYQSSVRNRFPDIVRAWRVGDVTPAHCRRLLAMWEQSGLADETINRAWTSLRMALSLARDEGGIIVHPMDGIRRTRNRRQTLDVWTPEQVGEFTRSTRNHAYGHIWQLMFATCARIGEVCALRWEDIDLDGGTVVVRRTWTTLAGDRMSRGVRDVTKTGLIRSIPLPDDVVAMLTMVRDRDQGEWVAQGPSGPVEPGIVRTAWYHAIDAAKLPRITPHGARHTGATNMIAAGVPVTVVQRILGHSDPAMTMRRYVHPDAADAAGAVELLSALYRGEMSINRAQTAPKVVAITEKDQ